MTLYQLTAEQIRLMEILADPETDADELADTIEAVQADFEDKADAYGQVYTQLMADAEQISDEIERLTAMRKSKETGAKRLKEAMLRAMLLTGQSKVEGKLYAFSTRKSKAVVTTGTVPDDFLIAQEPKVDKRKIADYLKLNPACDWAAWEEHTSLIVR